MPCYYPVKAYAIPGLDSKDPKKKRIVFKKPSVFRPGKDEFLVNLPCGRCVGCRLSRARQWAIRCVHEASLYDDNCFITLTFNDQYYNPSGSLMKKDFVLFMKRLRKKFGSGIRFFHCGEYGAKGGRPHHHACLFNFDFPDKVLWKEKDGVRLYRSEMLEKLWSDPVTGECFGFCTIGDVTQDSAAYVARYVLKKINGDDAEDHYQGREPEYITMSRRPGIGKGWMDKWASDIYPEDELVVGRMKLKPPKYYDKIYMLQNPEKYESIVVARMNHAKGNPDNAEDRLKVREKVAKAKLKLKQRSLEDES